MNVVSPLDISLLLCDWLLSSCIQREQTSHKGKKMIKSIRLLGGVSKSIRWCVRIFFNRGSQGCLTACCSWCSHMWPVKKRFHLHYKVEKMWNVEQVLLSGYCWGEICIIRWAGKMSVRNVSCKTSLKNNAKRDAEEQWTMPVILGMWDFTGINFQTEEQMWGSTFFLYLLSLCQ